jgi:kinetochor protein Mis14/NSL1
MDFDPSSSGAANSANNNKGSLPFSSAFTAPETVEYEPYDGALASRVTSLYAQLESLTTTVAQLRRDAPKRAAKMYADALTKALEEDEAGAEHFDRQAERGARDQDVEMTDDTTTKTEDGTEAASSSSSVINPAWKLQIPFGSDAEAERWHNGEIAEIYSDTLRTLLRLQGEVVAGDDHADLEEGGTALATTVGKAERAGRAAEVVEKM